MIFVLHWLAVHTGTESESSHWYAFWSGFGSDIGEVTIFAGVIALFRAHNCHTAGCWRIGRHEVEINGTKYKVCRVCHKRSGHAQLTGDHLDEHRQSRGVGVFADMETK